MHEAASRELFAAEVETLTDRLARVRGWLFKRHEYPIIDCEFRAEGRTPLRVQLSCDGWNTQPPSIALLSTEGTPLGAAPPNPTGVFFPGLHPGTGRPFICMRGSREYHIHPSHVADYWEQIKDRDSYRLGGILTQVWKAWLKGAS